ncbi:hypothetical protein P691DRAFT_822349, partial [Macrolepiota fuliginosa MF-IS2]
MARMPRLIIEIIITSIRQKTTPFLWAFFSRPEPHIKATFESEGALNVCWRLTLPVSRDANQDIKAYLRYSFQMIWAKYQFPRTITGPSENDMDQLFDQSAGLFIYAASAIRQISQSPLGPEKQLQAVLGLGIRSIDALYHLIMEQIPKEIRTNTRLLLLA